MDLLAKPDSEILKIAETMWSDTVQGSNEKNWELFSKHMPEKHATRKLEQYVESQWSENDLLTTLTTKREYIGILRRSDCVLVLWKQWSTKVEGEFLAMLYLKEIDGKPEAVGTWIR